MILKNVISKRNAGSNIIAVLIHLFFRILCKECNNVHQENFPYIHQITKKYNT